jgi:hypothetical protein
VDERDFAERPRQGTNAVDGEVTLLDDLETLGIVRASASPLKR